VLSECLLQLDVDSLDDQQLEYIDRLMRWDGRFDLQSTAAVFYEKLMDNLHEKIFADEFSSKIEYSSYSAQLKLHKVFDNANSKWWDDISTGEQESRADILQAAFLATWNQLQNELGKDPMHWTWNKVHFLEHDHPIGRVASLRKYFNVGPFPTSGTKETLNNQGFRVLKDGTYKVSSIPSTRRIIDFSDIENSISILPTGQSGNPLSKHYKDQAEMYVNGEFRKMMLNEEEIKAKSESVLTFIKK